MLRRGRQIRDITTDPLELSHASAWKSMAENQEWHEVDILSLREGDKSLVEIEVTERERSCGSFFFFFLKEKKSYCFVV